MVEERLSRVYDKFRFRFYCSIFDVVREREGSLSAMEVFALEVIRSLGRPTIGEFADFLNISQSNATYKVNSLTQKGYLTRENSEEDRREYYLVLSDKYYKYASIFSDNIHTVSERMKDRFSPEELAKFDEMLAIMEEELMPDFGK